MAGEIVIGKQFFHELDQTLNAPDTQCGQFGFKSNDEPAYALAKSKPTTLSQLHLAV
ncbi:MULTISPECIES: hypothetical protein [Nitrosomonas]|nr:MULTISPECIES: hypothetical protein [Nitrosomonas]UVS63097.1 hypothetical protein NX761_08405 [Nitrosomonas sp. PLL12]